MQALDADLPRSSKAAFDQAVWRERTKNLEAKQAAAAAEAAAAIGNGAADSDHDSDHESAKAGSSTSQVGANITHSMDYLTVVKFATADARPTTFPNF